MLFRSPALASGFLLISIFSSVLLCSLCGGLICEVSATQPGQGPYQHLDTRRRSNLSSAVIALPATQSPHMPCVPSS